MSKIRVMHIVQPKGGGVERYTEMLLKYFDKEKYRNIFVCSKDYCSEDYTDFASSVLKVPMKRSIGIHDIKSILRVRKIIKRYKPDIVYMHSSKAGAIGRIANMGIKNYSIYNPHGWSFDMKVSKIKRNFYIYIERFLSRFTDKIVAISDYEKRIALENKIGSEDKIKVILNGIDFERYYNDCTLPPIEKEKLGIPKDSYVIGTLGRISKQKAPDTFIAAAALIKFK
ncbi:MAG: glycosyltransferase, partial [Acutalibacteraceae bacterium]